MYGPLLGRQQNMALQIQDTPKRTTITLDNLPHVYVQETSRNYTISTDYHLVFSYLAMGLSGFLGGGCRKP